MLDQIKEVMCAPISELPSNMITMNENVKKGKCSTKMRLIHLFFYKMNKGYLKLFSRMFARLGVTKNITVRVCKKMHANHR